jgi:hypothetical protein
MTQAVPTKQAIISLLDAWIRQRPVLDEHNYVSYAAYREEAQSIARDARRTRKLLREVARSDVTAEELAASFAEAYSGRLSLGRRYRVNGERRTFRTLEDAKARASKLLPNVVSIEVVWGLDYHVGQYWSTEYQRLAAQRTAK